MLIVSVGLQKSGSGLLFNLINDILIEKGGIDVRFIKEKYKLDNVLKYYNCNIEELNEINLKRLIFVNKETKDFVVKTHNGPTEYLKTLMKNDIIKVVCIIRDPRDVLISAMDHGRKILEEGENHTFAHFTTVDNALKGLERWLEGSIIKWLSFLDTNIFLLVKYEDLILNPIVELDKIAHFLDIDIEKNILKKIYNKYDANELDDWQKAYLHFNVGKIERFRTVLDKNEIIKCNKFLSEYLEKMQYQV